ncbi:putative bifunctional diguanylate cyclase/phosphodiesterase [Motilimonas pumila]|uniref:Phosphodiesterase n=1 Tax=Motilimonas pumila TaxID=2303987 RepID=A0A418YBA5_9GAMM|nr:GGDEF domain-containing phosphodiesterase [Motilimonas pumila]RJG40256.1 phosphodiesterase [Motilimonas pumila]
MDSKKVLYFGRNTSLIKSLVMQLSGTLHCDITFVDNDDDFNQALQQDFSLLLIDEPLSEVQRALVSALPEKAESINLKEFCLNHHSDRVLQQRIEHQDSLINALINSIPDLIFFKDKQSRFLGCNNQFEVFAGHDESVILGQTDDVFFERQQAIMCQQQDLQVVTSGESLTSEEILTYHNGEQHWIDMLKVPFSDKQGKVMGLVGVGRDITEKRKSEKRLKRAAIVYETTQEGIFITDVEGTILSINPSFTRITGFNESDVVGFTPAILKSGRHDEAFYQSLWHQLGSHGSWHGEIVNKRKNGELFHQWLNISSVLDAQGQVINYVATFTDLSKLKETEEKLRYVKMHDSLTGLANRLFFIQRLDELMQRAQRNGHCLAVMHLDIERFSRFNKNLGHGFGDKLLKEVAQQLTHFCNKKDVVARFGSDEYALILDELCNEQDAAQVAKDIEQMLSCGLTVDGNTLYLNCNIGISLYPDDGETPDSLIGNADAALQRVKQDRTHYYEFYTEEITLAAQRQFTLEKELRMALRKDEFEVYFQPQLSLKQNCVTGVETLLRWNHPSYGLIEPAQFLAVAEECDLISQIDFWVIRQACLQAKAWQDQGLNFGRLAVNISLSSLTQNNLIADLMAVLKQSECQGQWLEFEMFEDVLSADSSVVRANLKNITKLGIQLALDDYGMGSSSLYHMKNISIGKLKISREFLRNAHVDPVEKAIIKSIISLGDNLAIDVVSEGVETDIQSDYVQDLGCDLVQGYHVVAPMRRAEAAFYLRCNQ